MTERPIAPSSVLESSAFHNAMIHLYRGEMQRMTVWRQRLDFTTQWAIVLTAGLTSFALGSPAVPHGVVLLAFVFNTIFMLVEGRRYQHLHHSKWRIRLLEHNYFSGHLTACELPEPTWRDRLAADLRRPHFTVSRTISVRLRLRRNYLMLGYAVTAVWLTKLLLHPRGLGSLGELYDRLAVGWLLPGWLVGTAVLGILAGLTTLAARTPSEEQLEHWARGDGPSPNGLGAPPRGV